MPAPQDDADDPAAIDIVLPAFDEAATIERTVQDWLDAAGALGLAARVIVTEDGSTDGTDRLVRRLGEHLPVLLVHDEQRLGYSLAMVRGVRASGAGLVLCADGDGQCDPADLPTLLERLRSCDADVVVGTRVHRADPAARRIMSWSLRSWFRAVHRIRLSDPSSPFVLGDGASMRQLAGADPVLAQGYWWEFHVRARAAGLRVVEVPVHHRTRADGGTRVYRAASVPGIALSHVVGMWKLRDVR